MVKRTRRLTRVSECSIPVFSRSSLWERASVDCKQYSRRTYEDGHRHGNDSIHDCSSSHPDNHRRNGSRCFRFNSTQLELSRHYVNNWSTQQHGEIRHLDTCRDRPAALSERKLENDNLSASSGCVLADIATHNTDNKGKLSRLAQYQDTPCIQQLHRRRDHATHNRYAEPRIVELDRMLEVSIMIHHLIERGGRDQPSLYPLKDKQTVD